MADHKHLYASRAWKRASRAYRLQYPRCRRCAERGQSSPSEVVDHIAPHRGDAALFWDVANWQPLCKPCHDRHKQSEEARGYASDIGEDGWPVDPKHPANK
ncbi:MAG: HNH endonuclease [Pseudomonadota bacterium]